MENKKNLWQAGILALCLLMTLLSEIWKIQTECYPRENRAQKEESEKKEKPKILQPKAVSEELKVAEEEKIRVLLMTSDYQSYFHDQVTAVVDGKEVAYNAEDPGISLNSEPIVLKSDRNEEITVLSIERAQGHPSYEGTLEIYGTDQGLLLINEVSLETYLCAVVPSEMPSDYQQEALKAQAVCARTYAARQMKDKKLEKYHAMVDDSVEYQVYENIAPQPSSTKAVEETKGEILCQEGEPIQAYYFSTSAGVTSTDEVWEPEREASYLKSVVCQYDSQEPWSSWQMDFSLEEINQKIADSFGGGNLVSMEAVKRSEGGAITQINLYTDEGEYEIHTEYAVREFFSPLGHTIKQQNGEANGSTLLPSAYFNFTPYYDQGVLAGYHLEGKGYGHGVGMSQTAANQMALEGKNYQEILDYFFLNVELDSL